MSDGGRVRRGASSRGRTLLVRRQCVRTAARGHGRRSRDANGAPMMRRLPRRAVPPPSLAAVATFAQQHPLWEVVTLRCASALPAGPIDDGYSNALRAELRDGLLRGLSRGGWDAVYLSLHGAAITTQARRHPTSTWCASFASCCPTYRWARASTCMATWRPELAALLDVASVYRTHPHTDMAETAARVLDQLARCARWIAAHPARVAQRRPPVAEHQHAYGAPVRCASSKRWRAPPRRAPIGKSAVFGGFPYADTVMPGPRCSVDQRCVVDPRGDRGSRSARASADATTCIASHRRSRAIANARSKRSPPHWQTRMPASSPSPILPTIRFPAALAIRQDCFARCSTRAADVPCLFASFADPEVFAAARRQASGQAIAVTLGARFGGALWTERTGAGDCRARDRRPRSATWGRCKPASSATAAAASVLIIAEQPTLRVIVTGAGRAGRRPGFLRAASRSTSNRCACCA